MAENLRRSQEGTWGSILEKIKKVEARFWGKEPFTGKQLAFSLWKAGQIPNYIPIMDRLQSSSFKCDDLGCKVLNIASQFPENLRRLSLKLGQN